MDPTSAAVLLALIPKEYLAYVTGAVAVCGVLATMLRAPGDTSPQWYRVVYRTVNSVALNFGHAKNAVPAPVEAPKQ